MLNALRITLQFEDKIDSDLKKEYQQYMTQKTQKDKKESLYQINSLYKAKGSISRCFELFLEPYVKREEEDLSNAVMEEIQQDLADPIENTFAQGDHKILNSSLVMFSKMKHLILRGSSISSGNVIYNFFKIISKVTLV